MNRVLIEFVVVMTIALTGCSAKYVQPSESIPSAMLSLERRNMSAATSVEYYVFTNEKCTPEKGFGVVERMSWASNPTKSVRVPAGGPILIRAQVYTSGSGVGAPNLVMVTDRCAAMTSYVPSVEKKYRAYVVPTSRGCRLEIKDAATDALVPDMREIDDSPSCMQ